MNWTKAIFCGLVAVILLQACTIEKRRYMSGWHIDWHSRSQETSADMVQAQDAACEPDSLVVTAPVQPVAEGICNKVTLNSDQPEMNDEPQRAAVTTSPSARRVGNEPAMPRQVRIRKDLFQSRIASVESPQSTGGKVMGVIGFILLVISVGLLLIGLIADLGWTSLGLVIMAMLLAAVSFVFALIALLANRHAGDPSPWFVWTTLIIGGLAVFLWLKVLLDRA